MIGRSALIIRTFPDFASKLAGQPERPCVKDMAHNSKMLEIHPVETRLATALSRVTRLEEQGRYAEAVNALSPFWKGPGHEPSADLADREFAQLWLKAGSLLAALGSQQQRK